MIIFGSFYDNMPSIDSKNYTLVRVSRTAPPDWFMEKYATHIDLSDTLGPNAAMLKECPPNENWVAFKPRYFTEVLQKLQPEELHQKLLDIYQANEERPLLLLCYEPPQLHCHRSLIGEYIKAEIIEL
jgi:uncharacterized protein YeaO (DUF488 family)